MTLSTFNFGDGEALDFLYEASLLGVHPCLAILESLAKSFMLALQNWETSAGLHVIHTKSLLDDFCQRYAFISKMLEAR
ncbi:hypothetical protein C1752_01432 [Acaryochloris thomasi RCC1774]|uniref:Uncharacterized protein n=1 Tax=Acaryochloris thomasi RCC1774 TaxID=1764569 RepID=A0A2W1JTL8_9CYAN|nr:hypothetical protein C1752_01432 [Acaryochloris thomasi RCC1774]